MVVPQFPPEIVAEVQAWAEVGQPSEERKKTRATFSLVNKQWNSLVDHLTDVLILDQSDLVRLVKAVEDDQNRSAIEARTKSIEVYIQPLGKSKLVPKLTKALASFRKCEQIKIYGEWGWATFGPLWACEPDKQGLDLFDALVEMPNVRKFDYSGCTCCDGNTASITEAQIRSFARHWPKLEELNLARCEIEVDDPEIPPETGFLSDMTNLKTFSAQHGITCVAIAGLAIDLHATLTSLTIGGAGIYDPHFAELISLFLLPVTNQLVEFSLLDAYNEVSPEMRGIYDDLILELDQVQKLTISPYAVSDLSDVLGALECLEHVVLAVRKMDPYWAEELGERIPKGAQFPAREVATLIREVEGLERVGILSQDEMGWKAKERKGVERAGWKTGVEVEWLKRGMVDQWPYIYPPI